MFQTHAIDPITDTVIAYSRADGEVEAMLLQGGVITQLYRDPTQAGGWNVHAFGDHTDVIDLVAGVSAPAPKYNDPVKDPVLPPTLKVFYRTRAQSDLRYVAVHSEGPTPEFTTTTVPWKSTGKLQLSVGDDDSVLVAAITESSSLTTLDGRLYFWTDTHHNHEDIYPTSGSLTGFPYRTGPAPAGLAPGWAATITDPWETSTPGFVSSASPSRMCARGAPKAPFTASSPPAGAGRCWPADCGGSASRTGLAAFLHLIDPHVRCLTCDRCCWWCLPG